MDKKVTVLTPNGRRHIVSVSANTTLLQILETTCDKFGLNSEEFCLKHHRKEVGLTQMFRFSGLPNNCLLEMEPAEQKREMKNVEICLQLESGERLQGTYLPTKSVLHVVEELVSDRLASFASPVILYMRQEIVGKEAMSGTTLKTLGITEGRAMIRLMDKTKDELKTQANVYVPPKPQEKPSKPDDEKPRSASSNSGHKSGGFTITKDLVKNLKKPLLEDSKNGEEPNKKINLDDKKKKGDVENVEPEKPKFDWGSGTGHSVGTGQVVTPTNSKTQQQNQMEEEQIVEPEFIVIGDKNAILYSLDAASKNNQDLPDSFFELTVSDLKMILRDLKKISSGSQDAPLRTEKMREMEDNQRMLRKMGLYKNCVIRVQFPDRYVLQGMFNPTDTIATIQKWLKNFLNNSEKKFHLYTIPPKTILAVDKNLLDLDLIPNALIHFAFDEDEKGKQSIYVKSEFLKKLTSPEGAIYAAEKFRNINKNARSYNSDDSDGMDVDGDQPMSSRKS